MEIDNNGLPLHRDATFAIRPRIFLEGNFFVDVSPGTPSAPIAPSGHTFPIQQGTEPVQLDQVLTGLDSNTRHNLQTLLQQYGKAVKTGGPAYNRSIQFWLPAYKYTSLVAHDALGIEPNDLSNYIAAQGKVAGAFDAHPEDLRNLITNFNTTANAFAREDTALRNTVIRAAADAVGGDSRLQRAQRRLPAAARARGDAAAGRQVDRPDDRRDAAVHHPAAAARRSRPSCRG